MQVDFIDKMGTDLTVVNAARVSFSKESEWIEEDRWLLEGPVFEGKWVNEPEKVLSEADRKLIKYLAKHNHWTPFSHVQITLREKVPIFVARQRFKHMVGFTYNEVSRRYVSDQPEFFVPSEWRAAAENKKQGSSDEVVHNLFLSDGTMLGIDYVYKDVLSQCEGLYELMIKNGVAPEQARMVLPQSLYTEYYCTGSLAAWARAYKLRSDPHAQKEIQELAKEWNEIISGIKELEHSWRALTG